jgi:hypothetical protein
VLRSKPSRDNQILRPEYTAMSTRRAGCTSQSGRSFSSLIVISHRCLSKRSGLNVEQGAQDVGPDSRVTVSVFA